MFTSSSIPTNKKSRIYYAEKIFRICKWVMDTVLIGGIATVNISKRASGSRFVESSGGERMEGSYHPSYDLVDLRPKNI